MQNHYNNIYLVGLMGAGKTTIGRQLAQQLQWSFHDSDHEIESRTGVRIPLVFEIEGESGFRAREAQVIAELTCREHVVLATGGGVVLDPDNRARLRDNGWVVYLDVLPEMLYERTRLDRNRPLLQVENPLQKLRDLYRQRDALYRETAHCIVDGAQGVIPKIVRNILDEFRNHANTEG